MGYRVGTQSLYSPDVSTIYVPVFKSEGLRAGTAERLTEAVVKRIEAKSHYKVIARPTADSTLLGEITRERKGMALQSPQGDPRQYTLGLSVKVNWVDRRQRQIRQFDEIPWRRTADTVNSSTLMVPEFGHSQATSEQVMIDRIADQIVGMMEVPW